jgi:hypothetical protein
LTKFRIFFLLQMNPPKGTMPPQPRTPLASGNDALSINCQPHCGFEQKSLEIREFVAKRSPELICSKSRSSRQGLSSA